MAKVTPFKDTSNDLGPGAYDPIYPDRKNNTGVSSWSKSAIKRKLPFEERIERVNKSMLAGQDEDGALNKSTMSTSLAGASTILEE